MGNGPVGLRHGDEVVGITHSSSDSLLAVRPGKHSGCHQLVGSVELDGDWMTKDMRGEPFKPLVLE
jgi:hypothetical protein